MDSLIPTLKVNLDDPASKYRLLECTINPIHKVYERPISFPFSVPWPQRCSEVWVEFVLGHNENISLAIPDVHLEFNEAFDFSHLDKPEIAVPLYDNILHRDRLSIRLATNDLLRTNSRMSANYSLYAHFWFAEHLRKFPTIDPLNAAYGVSAKRVIPPEYGKYIVKDLKDQLEVLSQNVDFDEFAKVRGGMAFWRSAYSAGEGTYGRRINYPCTFVAAVSQREQRLSVVITPRLFDVEDCEPTAFRTKLDPNECISFWFHYHYTHDTAPYINDDNEERFRYLQRIIFPNELMNDNFEINHFPRLPFRYEVIESSPKLESSFRLPLDPPVWKCERHSMYPCSSKVQDANGAKKENGNIIIQYSELISDRRMVADINRRTIYASLVLALCAGVVIRILKDIYIPLDPEAETNIRLIWAGSVFFLIGIACFQALYVTHHPPRTIPDGKKHLFRKLMLWSDWRKL